MFGQKPESPVSAKMRQFFISINPFFKTLIQLYFSFECLLTKNIEKNYYLCGEFL